MNKEILTLNINSNAFEAMKEDFDKVLKRTLANMTIKESDEATLTLKLNITLTEMEVPNFDAENPNATRKIQKPCFDHKVSSVMQIKTEETGHLKGEYELVWDEDMQDFVMKPIDDGQRTVFDDDYVCETYTDITKDNKELADTKRALEEMYDYSNDKDFEGDRENE